MENDNPKYETLLKLTERGSNLIKQILTFCRKSRSELVIIEVLPLIEEVSSFLRATLTSNIQLNCNSNLKECLIEGDPIQIHQVLMNLITNSIHSLENKEGFIDVNLDKVDNQIKLVIKDNGCGIDEKTLKRIFDPYFSTKPKDKGSGLGLSVVQGIINSHKGKILVESKINEGTCFTIYFPIYNI